jgi:redox-sensitive bicupin YhaK (pirin superfamily)
MTRKLENVVTAQATSDGAGVRLQRSIGTPQLDHVDPFLLLDEFRSDRADDYIAGFPDHPHRGFETVTYMLAGTMRHEDHSGNRGELVAGSVQWMTAGRGIVHSEMPRQAKGLMWGFQLWVNLPAKDKMSPPRYQEFPPERIPEVRAADGVVVKLIAGEVGGVSGAVTGIATRPLYLVVALPAGTRFVQSVPEAHTALAYVFEGAAEISGQTLARGQLGVLGRGDAISVSAGEAGARLLLLAAEPIGEPIVRYGPFVMNTEAEIHQAIRDFRSGTLG